MDFMNTALAIAKAGAFDVTAKARAFDAASDLAVKQAERIAELEAALNLFVKQWNACGPNSDFGRYFSNVRDAANAALAVRS
jgi:hypothetical protein